MDMDLYSGRDIDSLTEGEMHAVMEWHNGMITDGFSKQNVVGIYGLVQCISAFHSGKIENVRISQKQTVSLFKTGEIPYRRGCRLKDIEETKGHFAMFDEMLRTFDEPLSESLIKKYHFCLKNDVFEDMANGYPAGEYKNRPNTVSDIATAEPQSVAEKMDSLIKSYETEPKKDIALLASFHSQFECIHPFQDGNGRVGRILLFKECMRHGIIPFIIMSWNKKPYHSALHHAQAGHGCDKLEQIFMRMQKCYFQCMKEYFNAERD